MKKVLLLASGIILWSFVQSKAQYFSIGPVAGLGASRISNMPGNERVKLSPSMGVGFVYSKDAHWGWGSGLNVSLEGYKTDIGPNTISVTPSYLRMPMRVYYFFGDYGNAVRPKLYLGPTVGLKVNESHSMNGAISNGTDVASGYVVNDDMFRTFDVGFNTGAGVNIRLVKAMWLNMDLGYNMGLIDAVKDAGGSYNMNENLRFNAGLLFGLK